MALGVTSKLFIAVLVTNVITAVAVGLGVRTAFTSGFESYIQEREEQRLTRLSAAIANAYRDKGSWEFLQGGDEGWLQLNREVRPDNRRRRPPPPEGLREPRPPPAVVLDMHGNVIAGDGQFGGNAKTQPIIVDGQQVGWLSVPVMRRPPFEFADRRFQEEQLRAGWIVAICAIAISAVVAWFLARGLLTPVKRLAAATRRLAEGEYSTRVASSSNDEIGRLVDDFNRLGNTLEKNEALRRNFMADASHELRTPIAVLKAELEAIQDGVRSPTPENIKSLQMEVDRLGKLVTDLHELSLADVGGLAYHFEDLDLAQLLAEALDGARERLAAQDLELETKIPATPVRVRADPQRHLPAGRQPRGKLRALHRSRRKGPGDSRPRCPSRASRLGGFRAGRAARSARQDLRASLSRRGLAQPRPRRLGPRACDLPEHRAGARWGHRGASLEAGRPVDRASPSQRQGGRIVSDPSPIVMIVEDEAKLAKLLEDYLRASGFETQAIGDGRDVLPAVQRRRPDLILLDLMLPGKGGLEVFREVRSEGDVPIIMVTALVEEVDRLIGLELGADDYICKPYSPREVVARVKAVLRRGTRTEDAANHGLTLDASRYEAMLDGKALDLTPVEFRLLNTLASRPGRIFPRGELLDSLYADHRVVSDRTVDSHVKNLRRKLQKVRPLDDLVHSVYGVGYKLEI